MSTPPVGVPTCYRHPDRETWIRCQRCERPICPDCMTEASVGFQCPDCVAEGRKSVRQARTTFGGVRTTKPGAVSTTLIGINVAVWLLITITGGNASRLVGYLALHARGYCEVPGGARFFVQQAACDPSVGRWVPGAADGAVWQLFTTVFTHVQPFHLAFNMFALWVLGPQLEHLLGRARYLALYLLAGLAGSVTVLWLSDELSQTVGASGAIFGLMGALVVFGLKLGGDIQGLLVWIGINLVLTFTLNNVSWQGHFGGLAGGALIAAVLAYAPRERRTSVQVAGLTGIGVVLALATVARMLVLA
ncbi:rhomboid family intramembrane serine protease [Nocardioides sp.]|uniref:rhomboid family intramembrane serine protease n=1 Tax=Nocardioides sp. TaxID=35761 RepID=UPI0035163DF7